MQAGQPTSNPCRGGSGVISQCFNSEMSLNSSRPWLPKINYDVLHVLTLEMQHTILWIMSPSLRLSSRFVILNGVWRLVSCSKFANNASSSSRRRAASIEELVVHISCHRGCFLQQLWNGVLVIINNKTMKRSKNWKTRKKNRKWLLLRSCWPAEAVWRSRTSKVSGSCQKVSGSWRRFARRYGPRLTENRKQRRPALFGLSPFRHRWPLRTEI